MFKSMKIFDLVIVGAGPAGLSASVYASRYGIKHLVIGGITGGMTTQTSDIGNWLGFEKISGNEYAQAAAAHVKSYGTEIVSETVTRVEKNNESFIVHLASGELLRAQVVLWATGTHHRELKASGEKELSGKGVSYCPTCDGFFFRGKTVAVVGGGDSAASGAAHLAKICQRVYVIVREPAMKAEKFWQEVLANQPHVEILYDTQVKEIRGEHHVETIVLDRPYQGNETVQVDGVFIEIGLLPNTQGLEGLGIEMDDYGYIRTGPDQSTSVPGLWAAGDITTNSNHFQQIVTAAAEGAIAANGISAHLQREYV